MFRFFRRPIVAGARQTRLLFATSSTTPRNGWLTKCAPSKPEISWLRCGHCKTTIRSGPPDDNVRPMHRYAGEQDRSAHADTPRRWLWDHYTQAIQVPCPSLRVILWLPRLPPPPWTMLVLQHEVSSSLSHRHRRCAHLVSPSFVVVRIVRQRPWRRSSRSGS